MAKAIRGDLVNCIVVWGAEEQLSEEIEGSKTVQAGKKELS